MIIELKVELLPTPFATAPWIGLLHIDTNSTLADLHLAMQNALDFANDHLYEFFHSTAEYGQARTSFDLESGTIASTPIEAFFSQAQDTSCFYLFDYGDEWLFKLTITPQAPLASAKKLKYPRLVSQEGVKPEQYPDFDDE